MALVRAAKLKGRLRDSGSAFMAGSPTSHNLWDERTSDHLQPKTAEEFPGLLLGSDRAFE
jgi:hypothetical protein